MLGFYNYTVVLTYLGLLSGVIGIWFAAGNHPLAAIICLMIAGLFDTFDGKIARTRVRTVPEQHFGIQLDSLCDMVCFGVLPCIIGYSIGMKQPWHIAVMFVYILAALIRLAYFNVVEEERQSEESQPRTAYLGLPVTSICLILPFIICLKTFIGGYISIVYTAALAIIALCFVSKFKIAKP
ncbi:MAG: CDP-alcohol phosphatidyltransferase family protein, partial [Clostridia bacterium]